MHHLVRTSAVRSVNELIHIAQFNGRNWVDFVTQSNECPVLIVTLRNKTRIIINIRQADKQFTLNDKTKIRIYRRHWNCKFNELAESMTYIIWARHGRIVVKESLLKTAARR